MEYGHQGQARVPYAVSPNQQGETRKQVTIDGINDYLDHNCLGCCGLDLGEKIRS